jgi:hypothetical protein
MVLTRYGMVNKMAKKTDKPDTIVKKNYSVRPCTCEHGYQDTLYGRGRRVHTISGTKDRPEYTCSVCGKKS